MRDQVELLDADKSKDGAFEPDDRTGETGERGQQQELPPARYLRTRPLDPDRGQPAVHRNVSPKGRNITILAISMLE